MRIIRDIVESKSKILWIPWIIKWLFDKEFRNSFERLYWCEKEMSRFKLDKIKRIINYAYEYVPFYRELYDKHSIKPSDINTLDDVSKLPILTKEEFKRAISEKTIFSREKRKWKITETHTTGSTGIPTTLYFDQFGLKAREINTIRAFFINGVFPDKRFLLLWRRKKLGKKEIIKSLIGIFKYIPVVDVMNVKDTSLDKENILELINEINKFNPQIIRGYVSALWVLGKFIKRYGLKTTKIEKIIASAEYLPFVVWDEIEEEFNCPVVNYYGGTEASPIGCSTSLNRDIMIFEDFYFVNLVDENNKEVLNGDGRILVTDYYNLYMPLIRYEIGDVAEWSKDKIGSFRAFKEVKGRINDVFLLPGNKLLFSHNWHIYFRDLSSLKCFKIIQEQMDYIKIFLVPFDENTLRKDFYKIKEIVENSIGREVKVEWNIVSELPLDKGDKFRAVQSKINWRDFYENKTN